MGCVSSSPAVSRSVVEGNDVQLDGNSTAMCIDVHRPFSKDSTQIVSNDNIEETQAVAEAVESVSSTPPSFVPHTIATPIPVTVSESFEGKVSDSHASNGDTISQADVLKLVVKEIEVKKQEEAKVCATVDERSVNAVERAVAAPVVAPAVVEPVKPVIAPVKPVRGPVVAPVKPVRGPAVIAPIVAPAVVENKGNPAVEVKTNADDVEVEINSAVAALVITPAVEAVEVADESEMNVLVDEQTDASNLEAEEAAAIEAAAKEDLALRAKQQRQIPAVTTGYLKKEGQNFPKSWKRRFFIVEKGVISYYEKETYPSSNVGLNACGEAIVLKNSTVSVAGSCRLCITSGKRKLLIEAHSDDSCDLWAKGIDKHIVYANNNL